MSSSTYSSQENARFVVGIDLGTTNSAVTYFDSSAKRRTIKTFLVPQWVAADQIEKRETLPSFHYEPQAGEDVRFAKREKFIVGTFARDHGGKVAGRLVSSAKSWLSHTGVDRTAKLLPWQPAEGVEQISPVEATSRYLSHLKQSWDQVFPEFPMAQQDVVITLPASFDEVARELTVRAAKQAGLSKIVLLEEPQAAFYAWVHAHAKDWTKRVSPGQKILICDIGGGTTDFTLIRVRATEKGEIRFHRVAVGEHLILGGDNLDLALAHAMESKFPNQQKISARHWGVLVRIACSVKEKLLGTDSPEKMTVHVPGLGAKLIGGSLQLEIKREEVEKLLIDGFLPRVSLDSVPSRRQSGVREMGLPYAPDHAITKYLAQFLTAHCTAGMTQDEISQVENPARPDIVLLNGGMFEATKMQQRLLQVLTDWFHSEPLLLDNERLDLAVSRGATYYGMVRRGLGERISAGLARTYYVGVESENKQTSLALCLLPAGTEVDQEITLSDLTFELRMGKPIQFPIYVSSVRLTDKAGELIPLDPEQLSTLPPIQTVIKSRRKNQDPVKIHLKGKLTEIGTLELWCVEQNKKGRWRLNFDVRSATQTERESSATTAEREGTIDEETWGPVFEELQKTFHPEGCEKPSILMKHLVQVSGMKQEEWPTSLLRRIGDTLMESFQEGRRKSPEHESRFLHLLGYTFRPGFGLAMDDWRIEQLWKTLQGNLIHNTAACRLQWWILWRRVAGGLSAGQQKTLADPILGNVRSLHRQAMTGLGQGSDIDFASQEGGELWRMLGSLELLPVGLKTEIGNVVLDLYTKRRFAQVYDAMIWTVGRLGARELLHGPLNAVLPFQTAEKWLRKILSKQKYLQADLFAIMLLARRTGDRYRDIDKTLRNDVLTALETQKHFSDLVDKVSALDTQDQGLLFGEMLPVGLTLVEANRVVTAYGDSEEQDQ